MLPKPQRLTQGFSVIFRRGAKIYAPFFVIRAVPAWDNVSRLAVTVSGKVEKRAVRRNRIRRRMITAATKAGFPERLSQPLRIVVLANSVVLEADHEALVRELQNAFQKLDGWRFPALKPPPKFEIK